MTLCPRFLEFALRGWGRRAIARAPCTSSKRPVLGSDLDLFYCGLASQTPLLLRLVSFLLPVGLLNPLDCLVWGEPPQELEFLAGAANRLLPFLCVPGGIGCQTALVVAGYFVPAEDFSEDRELFEILLLRRTPS